MVPFPLTGRWSPLPIDFSNGRGLQFLEERHVICHMISASIINQPTLTDDLLEKHVVTKS